MCIYLQQTQLVGPEKESSLCNHWFNNNCSLSVEDFSLLRHRNKKYILQLQNDFLIMT